MEKLKLLINYLVVVLLGLLIVASNFLNTDLFDFGNNNFAVWFVLSVLCFACGWFINKTLGWHFGGKVVFALVIVTTVISIFLISFFRDYFAASELLTENIILYSLRNITLGSMAFFGMAVVEILSLQKDLLVQKEKLAVYEKTMRDAGREAELDIREAKFKAQKIISEAELAAKNIILKKERIERELKEFIHAERELIKKYEEIG